MFWFRLSRGEIYIQPLNIDFTATWTQSKHAPFAFFKVRSINCSLKNHSSIIEESLSIHQLIVESQKQLTNQTLMSLYCFCSSNSSEKEFCFFTLRETRIQSLTLAMHVLRKVLIRVATIFVTNPICRATKTIQWHQSLIQQLLIGCVSRAPLHTHHWML